MDIRDYLRSRHVPFQPFLHSPTPSATRLAHCLHVPGRNVAKGVLLQSRDGYVLAVLPATHRVDLVRLASILGVSTGELRFATEDEMEQVFPDCERGALPPFGRLYGLRTIIDASLAGASEIVVKGNTRHQGVRLRFLDYESVEEPTRGLFAEAIAPRRRRSGPGE